jgi:2-polyprenyl-3-methyl-5-hydroxy-6-metoxy-1,4-benzoquinol methylase
MSAGADWRGDDWEKWGKTDPYFAVITRPELQSAKLDDQGRRRFFESGESDVAETMLEMERLLGRPLRPRRTLDFGCGVGRLTIPLARMSETVVAVDVSPAMLDEARVNCQRAGVANVEFRRSTPGLAEVEGPFDFVHSYIVFQHIPPEYGYSLLDAILDRLSPDGSGTMHFTYARRGPLLRRLVARVRRSSRFMHRTLNLVQRRPLAAPLMAMFEYDLDRARASLKARGRRVVGERLTDHDGCLGVHLAFTHASVE